MIRRYIGNSKLTKIYRSIDVRARENQIREQIANKTATRSASGKEKSADKYAITFGRTFPRNVRDDRQNINAVQPSSPSSLLSSSSSPKPPRRRIDGSRTWCWDWGVERIRKRDAIMETSCRNVRYYRKNLRLPLISLAYVRTSFTYVGIYV